MENEESNKRHRCNNCDKKLKKKKVLGLCLACYRIHLLNTRKYDYDFKDSSTWKRKCPQCNDEIIYTSSAGCYYGIRRNSICVKCYKNNTKIPDHYCKKCNKKLHKYNTIGYCNNCNIEINKKKTLERKTYHCPECNEDIFSFDNKVTNNNIKRGYCYKCLRKRKQIIIPMKKKCIICNNEFVIYNKNQKSRKTCGLRCKKVIYGRRRKSLSQYITDAQRVHGSRYDYSKVNYKNSIIKIEVICKTHGNFWVEPANHLNGRGCPKCCLYISKGERNIIDWLEKNSIIYIHQKTFTDCIGKRGRHYQFDFYIPHKNLFIEYDGEQHYRVGSKVRNHILTANEVEDIKRRDKIKDDYAISRKIPLLRIPYTAINNIENILKKEIYG